MKPLAQVTNIFMFFAFFGREDTIFINNCQKNIQPIEYFVSFVSN